MEMNNGANLPATKASKLLTLALALLAVIYLLQMASPLRLGSDSLVLLNIGASVADGHGFLYHGTPTHFPSGYPAMVALLNHLGLASSWSFILMNCAFLGVALGACYSFYRNPLNLSPALAIGLCCLITLSYVLVKHVTLPMSDVPFLGVFTLAVLSLSRIRDQEEKMKWKWLLLALFLTATAITVRTAGVALLPAFAWVLGLPLLSGFDEFRKKHPAVLWGSLFGLVLFGLVTGCFISKTQYFAEMKSVYFQDGVSGRLLKNLIGHTTEIGEIAINVPAAKAPALMKPIIPLAGVPLIGLICRGVWLRRRVFGVLEIVLLTYGSLIFVWPWVDARFWLPALPLLTGFAAVALVDAAKTQIFKFTEIALFVWFVAAGLAALTYSTRISWSGNRFAEVYGDGSLRPTYRAAFAGQTNGVVNSDAMVLLKRYDTRTQNALTHNGI